MASMTINEEPQQVEITRELENQARTLAHSSRSIPNPSDSDDMLGELRLTLSAIEQVARQMGGWRRRAIDGEHYQGEA